MQASKSKNFKIIMSIMIPLLVIVTTAVMVGASFAWFTNAEKVTITEITMSTAQAYTIDFSLQGKELWENMPYVGQTAFCDSGDNAGKLMSKGIAGDDAVDISNRAYYFINTVALNTQGNTFDISMSFSSGTKITTYKYETVDDENGNKVMQRVQQDGKDIVLHQKTYTDSDADDIKYAFTWFFKESSATTSAKSSNYTTDTTSEGKTVQKLKQPDPTTSDVWYTPYGKLTFKEDDEKNVVVASVNGDDINDGYSIKNIEKTEISGFKTTGSDGQLFDFYIVFAPEKLFWMQFFSADMDNYTAKGIYNDATNKIFGNLSNQMFYSSMEYSGSTFEFSAVINVMTMHEEAQGQ